MGPKNIDKSKTTFNMESIKTRSLITPALMLMGTGVTTTLAGVQWAGNDPTELSNFHLGLPYALLLLLVLGSHEMGHYIAARAHGVASSLPHFLPFPPYFGLVPFGTLGAVIRIRSEIPSRFALFDIGVSGPISGFCVSLVVLGIGFATLPPIDFLYHIHPEYSTLQSLPTSGLTFGSNLAYKALELMLTRDGAFVPPMNEIYHYPFLCVGWFGLFITALNLIPIGQLDGGHIVSAAYPTISKIAARIAFISLIVLGALGLIQFLGGPSNLGWLGWGVWAALLFTFDRFASRRPTVPWEQGTTLNQARRGALYFAFVCFVSSFSPVPFAL